MTPARAMANTLIACAFSLAVFACSNEPPATPVVAEPAPIEPTATAAHHCEGSPAQCQQNAAPPAPQPGPDGDLYGAAMDSSIPLTALSELLTRRNEFADNVVRTTGTIGRVCQHRGCWMELRAATDDSVVRVPMAGHAFFVPSDSSGRTATVQGVASVQAGAENPLRIDATSVLIARLP